MRGKRYWFWLVLGLLILVACARNESSAYADDAYRTSAGDMDYGEEGAAAAPPAVAANEASYYGVDTVEMEAPVEDVLLTGDTTAAQTSLAQNQVVERLIIRNGSLNLLVTDTEETMQDISRLTQQWEGWVVSSSVYDYYPESKQGTIYIRVPVTQFDVAMAEIKDLAIEVQSESTNSEDVTDQYVDLNSRLNNLEATAERVRAFLDETQDVEEALAVNQELSRLEGEIEVLKGQMQYLSQSASFSTITVNLYPDIASQSVSVPGWRPEGTAKEAVENLVTTLQGIADFLIYFVISVLPVLLLVGLPLYFLVRWYWRRRRGRKPAPPTPSTS